MRGVTHATVGVAVHLLAAPILSEDVTAVTVGAAALGSLIPDLDHPGSMLSRAVTPVLSGFRIGQLLAGLLLIWLSWFLSLDPAFIGIGIFLSLMVLVPHRGVTHSLAGVVVAGVLAYFFAPQYMLAFLTGYVLHLVADMATGGVPLLWPKEKNVVLMFARTGGLIDRVCFILAAIIIVHKVWQLVLGVFF